MDQHWAADSGSLILFFPVMIIFFKSFLNNGKKTAMYLGLERWDLRRGMIIIKMKPPDPEAIKSSCELLNLSHALSVTVDWCLIVKVPSLKVSMEVWPRNGKLHQPKIIIIFYSVPHTNVSYTLPVKSLEWLSCYFFLKVSCQSCTY